MSEIIEKPWSLPRPTVVNAVLWPIAICVIIHAIYLGLQGDITNDYLPVFQALNKFKLHLPVYSEDLNSVNPHYLYPPSGSLLLSPLAFITYEHGRQFLIYTSIIAIILGVIIFFRIIGIPANNPLIPAALALLFSTESVIHTLSFTNINGYVFLAEALFLYLILRPGKYNDLIAGLVLGLTLAVKPILATFIIIALLYKKWKTVGVTIATVILLNLLALPLAADPQNFINRIIPFLLSSRSFFNSAIDGIFVYYGIDSVCTYIIRILLAIIAIAALIALYRVKKNDKPYFTLSFAGLTLVATILLGSLGQGYYSFFLLPLLLTVFYERGIGRNPLVWLGAYLCLNNGPWLSFIWPQLGRTIDYWRFTGGWTLILLAGSYTLLTLYQDTKAANKLP